MNWLLVAVGGGVGSAARYGLRVGAERLGLGRGLSEGGWPWATLAVNVLGCLAAGMLLRLAMGRAGAPGPGVAGLGATGPGMTGLAESWRVLLMTGVLGGFTTFSALGAETLELAAGGRWRAAGLNLAANVVLSLGACAAGYWAGAAWK